MNAIDVPSTYPKLAVNSPITDKVVELFALDHRGPRGETEGETKQQADYASKVNAIFNDYQARYGEKLTVADLAGPRLEVVIQARLDPKTGRPVRLGTKDAYRMVFRSLCTWLFESGIVSKPIRCAVLVVRKKQHGAPVTYTREQIEAILREVTREDTIAYRRLTANLLLILDGGLRNHEVCGLLVTDLAPAAGQLRARGKNDVERQVPVSPTTWRAIERYTAVRRSPLAHLFVNDDGKSPLRTDALTGQLNRVLTRLGLVEHLSKNDLITQPDLKDIPRGRAGLNIQALRRTFATYYVDSGRSEDELSAIMGWSRQYAAEVRPAYVTARSGAQLKAVHPNSTMVTALFR
jgi:integrase